MAKKKRKQVTRFTLCFHRNARVVIKATPVVHVYMEHCKCLDCGEYFDRPAMTGPLYVGSRG